MSSPRPLLIFVEHDDRVVLQTLLEFVTDLGHTAAGFASFAELRAGLERTPPAPDVIITSLGMGDDEAVRLLQETHQQHPKIAVMLITNGGRSLSASEAESCGLTAFLREPIRLSELELYLTRL